MFFPIQSIPYLRFVKRLFSGPGSLETIAYEKEILCPEESATIPPAVFLPGQLERVTQWGEDLWFETSSSEQVAQAISTTVTYAPTIAYHIKDAVLFDGSVYAGRFRYPLHPNADKSIFASTMHAPEHVGDGALASTFLGTRFFGHWLSEDCTKYLLAEGAARVVCARRSPYQHQQEYQSCLRQDWTGIDRARIDHLTIYQDFGQNSHKRKRYDVLRERLGSCVPAKGRGDGVYLKRGGTGVTRQIQNEDEIVDSLTKRGFAVVDVASDNLEHIVGTLLNAKVVVSMEGSHIAHCIYSVPKDSALLVLQPPDRFAAAHRSWSAPMGIRFGFVVGSRSEAGYSFSVAEILRTVDLLLGS